MVYDNLTQIRGSRGVARQLPHQEKNTAFSQVQVECHRFSRVSLRVVRRFSLVFLLYSAACLITTPALVPRSPPAPPLPRSHAFLCLSLFLSEKPRYFIHDFREKLLRSFLLESNGTEIRKRRKERKTHFSPNIISMR